MPHIQVLQTSHPWTDGWRPSEMFAYDQQTSKTSHLLRNNYTDYYFQEYNANPHGKNVQIVK